LAQAITQAIGDPNTRVGVHDETHEDTLVLYDEEPVVSERFRWTPLQKWLFAPELQWQPRGK
jgi:hypothetical protein